MLTDLNLDEIDLATINGISHEPTTYPILSQGNQNDLNQFCDKNNIPDFCSDMQICVCTHVISINYKSMVEFIMFDESPSKCILKIIVIIISVLFKWAMKKLAF